MDEDLDTVVAAELGLLDPDVRGGAEAVRALLHEGFREFGALGAVWDRQSVTLATATDTAERITARDLRPARLGPDAVLLTYTTRSAHAASVLDLRVAARQRHPATAPPPGNTPAGTGVSQRWQREGSPGGRVTERQPPRLPPCGPRCARPRGTRTRRPGCGSGA
ncbi:DUF4440 domain-containing protein [Haloactinospora alba]|uniref:DUF4440 domain-containing protein n=1 Tax=Haloactinospora alba TaxID=405555 RepID=UPI0037444EAC